MYCSPPGSSVHGDSPGKNPGVGCHFLLQGIFPTQGSKLGVPHCRQTLYPLSHQGSPYTANCSWKRWFLRNGHRRPSYGCPIFYLISFGLFSVYCSQFVTAGVYTGVATFVCNLDFFRTISRSGIAGSKGGNTFKTLDTCCLVIFQNGFAISCQRCMRQPNGGSVGPAVLLRCLCLGEHQFLVPDHLSLASGTEGRDLWWTANWCSLMAISEMSSGPLMFTGGVLIHQREVFKALGIFPFKSLILTLESSKPDRYFFGETHSMIQLLEDSRFILFYR